MMFGNCKEGRELFVSYFYSNPILFAFSLNIHSLKHYLIMNMKVFKRTNRTILNENAQITRKLEQFTIKDLVRSFFFFSFNL